MKDENDSHTSELPLETPAFRGNPPMVGWWWARRRQHAHLPFTARRWWNGSDWSRPVLQGASDAEAQDAIDDEGSLARPEDMEWTGRLEPASSYPYILHARNNFEAFMKADLDAQNALLEAAYGEKARAQHDAAAKERRTFTYD